MFAGGRLLSRKSSPMVTGAPREKSGGGGPKEIRVGQAISFAELNRKKIP